MLTEKELSFYLENQKFLLWSKEVGKSLLDDFPELQKSGFSFVVCDDGCVLLFENSNLLGEVRKYVEPYDEYDMPRRAKKISLAKEKTLRKREIDNFETIVQKEAK